MSSRCSFFPNLMQRFKAFPIKISTNGFVDLKNKTDSKVYMERQKSQKSQYNMNEKTKVKGLILKCQDLLLSYNKTVRHWWMNRHIGQWNRIEPRSTLL